MCGPLPEGETLVDTQDIEELACKYTKPLRKTGYIDPTEVKDAFAAAKISMLPADWKAAHKLRKAARKSWMEQRLQMIVAGDWGEFRKYKSGLRRRKGWWRKMLCTRSSKSLTDEVSSHLRGKMADENLTNWDEDLSDQIANIPVLSQADWTPFSLEEVYEQLQGMKTAAAVGTDMVGVDLLRQLARHEDYGPQLVGVINHIVYHNERPEKWISAFSLFWPRKPCPLPLVTFGPFALARHWGSW